MSAKDTHITVRSDGKKSIKVCTDRYGNPSMSFCHNKWQTTVVSIDREMMEWLSKSITDYLKASGDAAKET